MDKGLRIIGDLYNDTLIREISWDVEIVDKLIRAVYKYRATKYKTVVFRIVFFQDDIKKTKLYVLFENRQPKPSRFYSMETICDVGGKNDKERHAINELLSEILLQEEEKQYHV